MMRASLLAASLLASFAIGSAMPTLAQSVALNQSGYLPKSRKVAILYDAGQEPVGFRVMDGGGKIVLEGKGGRALKDPASGKVLQHLDFSGLSQTGDGFRLSVGDVDSAPFSVADGVYAPIARDSLAYFYHNRAGVPIEARFAGGDRWARPAGHPNEVATCFRGEDQNGNQWPGCSYRLEVSGGWYDAGDHGKYVVNGGISLWTLLNLYERLPSAFPDGSLAIPEAGNGVNDLLDHARFQMEFMLKMQVPDGTRLLLPIGQARNNKPLQFSEIDAGGMAHHKVADIRWTGLPMRPDLDPEVRVLHQPSTAATLNLAATAAQCARIWKTLDAEFAGRCRLAAERAWKAALRHPDLFAVGDFAGSGGYGDSDLSDEFYWAAAELYATTGGASYAQMMRSLPHFARIDGEPGWPTTAPLGTLTLLFEAPGLPEGDKNRLRASVIAAADRFLDERRRTPSLIPYASLEYRWGSNSNLLNRAMLLATAYDLTQDPRYRDGVVDVMDYLLGRNPLGISYLSGHGSMSMQRPHHRFWAESLDPAFPPPPPGAISGGPNNTAMSDDVARKMQGKCAPQACWVDDPHAFALNEVAINWNAPMVWVATWLDRNPPR